MPISCDAPEVFHVHFQDGAIPDLKRKGLCSLPVPGVLGCVQPGALSHEERKGEKCYKSLS